MQRTGLLGGSFNPAHPGHRRIARGAIEHLGLDELWLMVSPGNPLKDQSGDMAPLAARLASARQIARRSRIRATSIERELGTRYTAETLLKLVRRYPKRQFIWVMGADNLADFHRWRNWRDIARTVPIAVIARPGYDGHARTGKAWAWLRHFVRPASQARYWTNWRPPALVLLRFLPDPASATLMRRGNPGWHVSIKPVSQRDPVTRRLIA
ncbi:MAG: nicotinate-nucleotide adenylyltransferase [Sphingomonadaceae bacterium]